MLHIETEVVTPFAQNARVVMCEQSREAVVIDPGGEAERLLSVLNKLGARCTQIWLTHSHLDHCGAVSRLKKETGAALFAHPAERLFREKVEEIATMYGVPPGMFERCPEPDNEIGAGDTLRLAEYAFNVLFTPGHSPGHVCFYAEPEGILVAGDTLFAGSIGRSDLPLGDHATLMRSIREVIMTLPAETRVLPGHGPDTTVGKEARTNPFLVGGGELDE